MLAIRMQRTGRKGSAQFRVVVQESQRTPTSGNIVALLGHYDPHAKVTSINKEKAAFYLKNGAQPSDRVIRIFQHEDIEIPKWVKMPTNKTATTKNLDKLRKNRPVEVVEAAPAIQETPAVVADGVVAEEAPVVEEAPIQETPATEVETKVEETTPEEAVEEASTDEAVVETPETTEESAK